MRTGNGVETQTNNLASRRGLFPSPKEQKPSSSPPLSPSENTHRSDEQPQKAHRFSRESVDERRVYVHAPASGETLPARGGKHSLCGRDASRFSARETDGSWPPTQPLELEPQAQGQHLQMSEWGEW